jgi:hypothetical protein
MLLSSGGRFLHSAGSAARRQLQSKTGKNERSNIISPVFDQKRQESAKADDGPLMKPASPTHYQDGLSQSTDRIFF